MRPFRSAASLTRRWTNRELEDPTLIPPPSTVWLMNRGTPLGELVKRSYLLRGVITGLNDAFVIDQDKRDELIEDAPALVLTFIKPWLRGRDIKRWRTADWQWVYM